MSANRRRPRAARVAYRAIRINTGNPVSSVQFLPSHQTFYGKFDIHSVSLHEYIDGDLTRLTSRGNNAGIRFPIGDVYAHLRRTKSRYLITNDAAVFVGGVIDYLCVEVLEQAGYLGTLKGNRSRVIQPVHLRLVFSQDQELRLLLRNILPTSSRHYPDQGTMEQDLNHTFQSLSIGSE